MTIEGAHRSGSDDLFVGVPGSRRRLAGLLVGQWCALAGQVIAVGMARQAYQRPTAELISDASLVTAYSTALWALTAPHLDRVTRNAAAVCLGLTPTLMWRATNPMLFTGFDEQLHMRTLGDILSSHRLFEANPLLEVSPRYPGLELATVLVHQTGIPTMLSATVVVLLARLVLVTVLCDAVERITGSARAGGLAIAVYAISPQFVFFNSQYAYQTLAIPLALAATSMIARARNAADPLPFLGGATVCLLAVAMTHHVTSFLISVFLPLWALAEKKESRIRVLYGALAAIACTLAWAVVQRSLLTDYFGPIIKDVTAQFGGGARRKAFSDSAGTATPLLDQLMLLYYAAALCLVVLALAVLAFRWWRRGEDQFKWGPHLVMLGLAACLPVFLAARVVPKGGELFDRSSSFLFIPFSLLLAGYATRLWWITPPELGGRRRGRALVGRVLLIALASGAFLGGYVLGSGPNWARLPGPYLVAADTRSMDAETLAAVKWAKVLPAGSRIAGDRVSSILLAAQAGLWPVMKGPVGVDAPALYVASGWGMPETDMAASMRMRYLYVDRRLATEMPHFGSYFFSGETGMHQQLTDAQLTKFDQVPGISAVYRHGPVTIYDLKGLGLPQQRSGWFGATPLVRVSTQLAVGLLCGVSLSSLIRSRLWPRIATTAQWLRRVWGPALTGATCLASLCLISAGMLLTGVWLTPLTIFSGVAVVLLTNFSAVLRLLGRARRKVSWPTIRFGLLLAVPLAIIVAAALYSAATENIIKVQRILEDPAALQVPPYGSRG